MCTSISTKCRKRPADLTTWTAEGGIRAPSGDVTGAANAVRMASRHPIHGEPMRALGKRYAVSEDLTTGSASTSGCAVTQAQPAV